MECIFEANCFGGLQRVFRHPSRSTRCDMEFAVYLPPEAKHKRVPVLIYLSGLTCTWANVTEKSGVQRFASSLGLMLVMPDTSPRGLNLPGEEDDWDFGTGAGFYVDAEQAPWKSHYRMFEYVTDELPELIRNELPTVADRFGIMGHSMGGHGALVCALRRPDVFRSCSAFAPIAAPSKAPWGQKAFRGYLGEDRTLWQQYDACALIENSDFNASILVDQGEADPFLEEQLKPHLLQRAFYKAGRSLELRLHPGYDHSYYFIASFIGEHLAHHAEAE